MTNYAELINRLRHENEYADYWQIACEAASGAIETLQKERDAERKNCLRVSYERDEAIREIGIEARKRGYAEAERDAARALLREAGEALADTLPVATRNVSADRARDVLRKIREVV